MTEQAPAVAAGDAAVKKPTFSIQRLYTKDISFETPGAPAIFTQTWEPETNVQFGTATTRLSETQYEVVLQLTVNTTVKGKVAYIAEVKYAGIFHVEGIEGLQLEHVLASQAPAILFPYVRELISEMIGRGTFPQFVLQPMNFEAIFNEAKRRRDLEATTAADAPKH